MMYSSNTLNRLRSNLKPYLTVEPYDYQLEGIQFMLTHKHVILGDEMGLGKTLQALAVVLYAEHPTMIICPAYLQDNWKHELEKFDEFGLVDNIHITSYGKVNNNSVLSSGSRFSVIVDEAHYTKNPEAQRSKKIYNLIAQYRPEYSLLLTGTPCPNGTEDWYNLLRLCSFGTNNGRRITEQFSNIENFKKFFCKRDLTYFKKRGRQMSAWKYHGVQNEHILEEYKKFKYLGRKAEDVLELPEKREKYIYFETEINDQELKQAWEEWKKGASNIQITKRKAESALRKAEYTAKYVEDLLSSGVHPIVCFSDHIAPLIVLAEHMRDKRRNIALITGKVKTSERSEMVEKFQAGEIDLLLGTIGSCSTGLNLFRASHMVFNDLSWTPANNDQAKARIWRIGQRNNCLYHFITGGPVDKDITESLNSKQMVIQTTT